MALASAYAHATLQKEPVDTLILSHFDSHGVATAAARMRVLQRGQQKVRVVSKFPETGPQGLSSGTILQLVERYAPKRIEVIDIPIDVRNPVAAIDTLAKLVGVAPVYYFDHHETDLAFIEQLYQRGIYASIFGDAVSLAVALRILDGDARELAIIGIVADRDSSILRVVGRQEVEQKYLPLANRLDVIVRQPSLVGCSTPGDVAELLAERGLQAIPTTIEYPPEALARESTVLMEGTISLLIDWTDMAPQYSMWVPKTLEQLLLLRGKYLAILVCPGYNPRTRTIEGYDVRVLRYWLSPSDIPVPEALVKDVAAKLAVQGNIVGHADYVSLRFGALDEARRFAEEVFQRVEGRVSEAARLVNERYVAQAIQRDYSTILQRLTELLEEQRKMYREYLELKRRQVELLERHEQARAD